MNVSSNVSFETMFCSGHNDGHPAPPSRSSLHATSVPTTPVKSTIHNNRLRKPYTPSFDVKAVYDSHDDRVDRAVLRDGGQARRATRGVENHFAPPCSHTVDRNHVPALLAEVRGEVLDHQ